MKKRFGHLALKRGLSVLCVVAASVVFSNLQGRAQCPALVSGLHEPMGTVLTNHGNLVVSENGTTGLHSGRISIVDPVQGNRRTLLEGLPSAISDAGEPSGPHGIVMRDRTLYVAIGTGDVGRPGPIPGTTIPNPDSISSPIFSSVLAIHFSAAVEENTTGFNLTSANQQSLANGQAVHLTNGGGDSITIQLVADFPDYVPFPLPSFPDNIQLSNPFHMILEADNLYVTDGGRNLVWQVDIDTGSYSELVSFPNIPNPVFPTFGGPMLEAVPTGIASSGNQILVTLFRGFPFPPGMSTIQQIDPLTGDSSAFISGLRSAIGVLPITQGGNTSYLVLQHNSGDVILPPFAGPGLLLRFETPNDPPSVVADCLTRPTSMTLDQQTGKVYVSELAGRVVVLDARTAEIPTDRLQLWLRSDAGVVLNGPTVSAWEDQSGNGNDVIQTNANRQPVLVENELNGKPVLRFDGEDDRLGFTGSKSMTRISVFTVFKNRSGSSGGTTGAPGFVLIFGPGGTYVPQQNFVIKMRGFGGSASEDDVVVGNGNSQNFVIARSANLSKYDQWRNISIVRDSATHNTTFRWNGIDAEIIPVGSDLPISVPLGNPLGTGGGLGATDNFSNLGNVVAKCDIAEVIVYDTVLSHADRLVVEEYLNNKYDLMTGVDDSQNGNTPRGFVLSPNYPNPFNPSTVIGYQLGVSGHATLKVYNLLGREVATLVNEAKSAGTYEVTFDASDLSSGVYIYRLAVGGFSASGKMVLVR